MVIGTRMNRLTGLIAVSICIAMSCISTPSAAGAPLSASTDSHEVKSDIPYLGAGRAEKLDLYLPDKARFTGPRPAVVMVHGGGWYAGDKATPREKDIGSTLANAGFAVFSINYKLNRYDGKNRDSTLLEHAWPTNLQDCRQAVRFVRREAATYNVDPERIALLGTSAGGHLSMLAAFAPATLAAGAQEDQSISKDVKCVITMYAPHHLRDRTKYWPTDLLGEAIIRDASPDTYFAKGGPPVLILHGDKDTLVPPSYAKDLEARLTHAGVTSHLVWVQGAGHSFHFHPSGHNLSGTVRDFLAKYMK
ncbi:alpha/beta hydrolase [Verrucomicrobia bacterium LW23]|nr:alpha/beta hydrolase [Verrucomicrobia bacterium LW23]